ncbi:MAG TPA: hypothetical protein VD966_04995 [Pyrinomonadaceae bacterium]|nr:hypothetical protein [Pyrinomonadaceae bacterium]
MIYLVFILAFALACVAGVQFLYLMFLQNVSHHDKRRIVELETKLGQAQVKLEATAHELEIAEQRLAEALQQQDDAWPEIIDN